MRSIEKSRQVLAQAAKDEQEYINSIHDMITKNTAEIKRVDTIIILVTITFAIGILLVTSL